MDHTKEIFDLLIRFTKDSENLVVTRQDLYKLPWWRCVWGHWRAKAYYKLDGYYERQEDVPEGLETYTIITDTVMTQHFLFNGYPTVQTMDKAACKKYYD